MYELLIKILGEKDYKKYTIKEIQEIKIILEEIKQATEEIRLKRIENKGEKKLK